mgnify:FL=1|jgi:hypothetical protein
MRKLILFLLITIGLASCGCPDNSTPHKYEVGQDIHLKHKSSHSDATITKQLRDGDCNCMYEVSYYSTLNVRRHRVVTEGEIEISDNSGDNGLIDQLKDGVIDVIKEKL